MKRVLKIEGSKREVIGVRDFDQLVKFYSDEAWVNNYGIRKVFNGMISVIYNDGMWEESAHPVITVFQDQEWVGPIYVVKVSRSFHLRSLTKKEAEEYINER